MKQRTIALIFAQCFALFVCILVISILPAAAQSGGDTAAMTDAIRDLREQVTELRSAVTELRTEASQYRAETESLRRELEAQTNRPSAAEPSTQPEVASNNRITEVEDSIQLLTSKLDDQYQTKIESASKYHMRLSGILLLDTAFFCPRRALSTRHMAGSGMIL